MMNGVSVRTVLISLAERTDTDVDERLVRVLDLTALYVIWIGGLLIALRELGIEVTGFVSSRGIAGLAVALAAKTVLSNVLAGGTLTADRNFRVGDRIEVAGIEIPFPQRVVRLEGRGLSGPEE